MSGFGRVTSLADNLIGGGSVASYAYAGLSRRIGSALGNGATQSYRTASEAGYAGLDRFGRVADSHYKDSTSGGGGLTLRRDQYGYDRAGNRLYDRVTQRKPNVANQTWDNVRSWLYQYDGLQRLVGAHMGRLNAANNDITPPDAGVPLDRRQTWDLDNLSNWSGDPVAKDSFSQIDSFNGGNATTKNIHHEVDHFNRITEVDLNGNLNADTVYDIAGNLVFDQDYFYQYDAWGRLVQVNRMLGMTAADFDGEGRLLSSAAGHVGDLVAHYSYDGLGRLMVKTVLTAPGSSTKQHQHHYYDGVRRVQEQFYTESSGGGGTWTTRREYIHGADYVDEYVLQVHNPACDGGGGGGENGGGCGGNGCGGGGDGSGGGGANEIGVYEQYTHEPYGQLAALDKFITTPPQNPLGHQGLFYDHYCATSPLTPCLQVAHKGLYQNRNRFYHPKLGRFTTPDPNSSAIPLIEGAAYHGMTPTALAVVGSGALTQYSPMGQFGDGMNLYGYLGNSPVNLLDALGLEGDWDEELDEQISERTGNALYALGTINESARVASIGLQTAVRIAKNFLPGSCLLDAFESVKIIASGKGGFCDAVNIATAAFPIAKGAAKLIGLRSLFKARVWKFKGCNCFIGGTLVDTPEGARAIEDLEVGGLVFTWPEAYVGTCGPACSQHPEGFPSLQVTEPRGLPLEKRAIREMCLCRARDRCSRTVWFPLVNETPRNPATRGLTNHAGAETRRRLRL